MGNESYLTRQKAQNQTKGPLHMKFTKILFGFMNGNYDCKNGVGMVAVDDPNLKSDIKVTREKGPFFVGAGNESPYFLNGEYIKDPPINMTEVALEVAGRDDDPVVIAWGLKKSWDKTLQVIGSRPHFRAMTENRFKGQMMSHEVREVKSFEGNLKDLVATSARTGEFVSKTDKFAPVYQAMKGITALNRFQRRTKNGATPAEDVYVDCQDPRPFPVGAVYRLTRVVDGKMADKLGIGTALELNFRYPLGASTDKLARFKPEELIWEKREVKPTEMIHKVQEIWVEVADPRPKLELPASMRVKVEEKSQIAVVETVVTAPATESATTASSEVPATAPIKKSVAMPKRPKKVLSTRVNGFATLEQVLVIG